MIRLTKTQVLSLHSDLIQVAGGSDGVRDNALLDSALESPFQTLTVMTSIRKYSKKPRDFVIPLFRITLLLTETNE